MDKADQLILEQLNKEVPHERTCLVCGGQWQIFQEDIDLLKKIIVPLPTECPECNHRHRMAFRNEQNLYKRKCDATSTEIISNYSPDKPHKIYDKDYWYANSWDPMTYGQDYDPTKSFFEQISQLFLQVPFINLFWANSENSDYINHSVNCKNCYLLSTASDDENCYFGKSIIKSKNSLDCYKLENCENCYENIYSQNNNFCIFLFNSIDCHDCHFSENLTGCNNCLFCFNLTNKEYFIRNQKVTKEEYEKIVKNINFLESKEEFLQSRKSQITKFANIINSENCSGDFISNSKDCYGCFGVQKANNARYALDANVDFVDAYCTYSSGIGGQLHFNSSGCATSYQIVCSNLVYPACKNIFYSIMCQSSNDLFGCVGLRHKQYCILNKQYSKEEYEKIIEQIKLAMLEKGEYGDFFPISMSPFGVNETIVQDFFPLTKEEALKLGFNWSDYDPESNYSGSYYEPLSVKEYFDENKAQELLAGVLKCEVTGKPFKIMGPELAFYLKHNIPIPKRSPNQRHKDRMALKNPYRLWHRQCMCEENGHDHAGRCLDEFETTYAPERTEKVYCEGCYRKSIL